MTRRDIYFSDDAEHGNLGRVFTSRHDGDPLWSIETSAASHSGNHRFRSNAGRNYTNNTATFMTSPAFSLAGVARATLTFRYKFETEDSYDNFYLWASGDDGHAGPGWPRARAARRAGTAECRRRSSNC